MVTFTLGGSVEFQRLYRLTFLRLGRRHFQIERDADLWDWRYWTWDLSRDTGHDATRRVFIGPFEISWHREP